MTGVLCTVYGAQVYLLLLSRSHVCALTSLTAAIFRLLNHVSTSLQKTQNVLETSKISTLKSHLPQNPPFWICHVIAV